MFIDVCIYIYIYIYIHTYIHTYIYIYIYIIPIRNHKWPQACSAALCSQALVFGFRGFVFTWRFMLLDNQIVAAVITELYPYWGN